jgi:hypothetical protein
LGYLHAWLLPAAFALGLSGCASMPPFDAPVDANNRPTVATIIDKVQCEIAEARDAAEKENSPLPYFKPFGQWTAAVTLTLTVDDDGGTPTAGIPLSFITPLPKTTTFAVGFSPTIYQLRTRTYTQTYTISIASIPHGFNCKDISNSFNLTGDLGLKEQIYMGLHAFNKSQDGASYYAVGSGTPPPGQVSAKTADTFGATVFFHLYYGVTGIGPTWTLRTFKGPSAGVGYVRDDLHQIVITFAPAPAPRRAVPAPKPPGNPPGKAPEPPPKPMVLNKPPPPRPTGPVPEASSPEFKPYREQQEAFETYFAVQQAYERDLQTYYSQVVAYTNEAAIYQAKVAKYNAELAAYTQSLSANAGDAARIANQAAVTNQAIQSLGQILSRP